MKDFTDKVVVITGAASGIGKALAIAFAKHGAQLALNDVNEEALANLSAVLTSQGVSVFSMAFSVSESREVHKFSAQVINHYGQGRHRHQQCRSSPGRHIDRGIGLRGSRMDHGN